MTTKQKSGKGKHKFVYFREVDLPDVKFAMSGASFVVRIPSKAMKKYRLKVGMRLRPTLIIYAPELKTKVHRIVNVPITPLRKSGNSHCFYVPMFVMKRFNLTIDTTIIRIILLIKDTISTKTIKPNEVIVIMDERKKIIPKSDYIKMEYLLEQDRKSEYDF